MSNAAGAIDLLKQGKVQAIVFDSPTLHHWLATSRQSALQIVGSVFMPEMFGIAVALGSPLRKRINEALLEVYQDGTYAKSYGDWFARRESRRVVLGFAGSPQPTWLPQRPPESSPRRC